MQDPSVNSAFYNEQSETWIKKPVWQLKLPYDFQIFIMRCRGCMSAEVSPVSLVPRMYLHPVCHRLRLWVKCHISYNPSILSLNSLCTEDRQVSLMSRAHHQPCPTELISSGPLLKKPYESICTQIPLCFQNIPEGSQLLQPLLRAIHSSRSSANSNEASTLKKITTNSGKEIQPWV